MGNPFVHIELSTGDLPAAKRFYRSLFDWKLEDTTMEGGTYTTVDVGRGTGGGMQAKMSSDQATGWMPYVQVDDVKRTLNKARRLGAEIVFDFADMGSIGTIGILKDPTGALLGVWAPPKKPSVTRRAKAAGKKAAAKTARAAKKVTVKASKTAGTVAVTATKKVGKVAGKVVRGTSRAAATAKKSVRRARKT
ncbi:MAG: VOC family protein [Myxococcales bacterium]|jgi:predicted enzyme related to lactoylglutathione lyase